MSRQAIQNVPRSKRATPWNPLVIPKINLASITHYPKHPIPHIISNATDLGPQLRTILRIKLKRHHLYHIIFSSKHFNPEFATFRKQLETDLHKKNLVNPSHITNPRPPSAIGDCTSSYRKRLIP
ncbi:hypothetical protein V6N13_108461 [Hibiscus sabdariffa]